MNIFWLFVVDPWGKWDFNCERRKIYNYAKPAVGVD